MREAAQAILLWFVVPMWLAAGFADWLCHRHTRIEATSGTKESLIHLLMFAQMGVPVLCGLFLQVNAGILALMVAVFLLHEATVMWDLRVANAARPVLPLEQKIHSYLELLPLAALCLLITLHWTQWQALFGMGEPADFGLRLKDRPLPAGYLAAVCMAALLLIVLPFCEETWRCLRHARRRDAGAASARS
ncbi:diguanylate cyclase [Orrella sp. JC864]|uniref:diguanylate cyclase n=1 Tax=Orrella sp. JC864 TaxID=3120298 RepID=UPI00300A01F3